VIVVIGATGTVGRQVVTQLRDRGTAVRAVSRYPAAAGLPDDVEVVHADLAEPGSLTPHLGDATAAFLIWPFTSPEQTRKLAPEVISVLARSVPRIVYVSAAAAAYDPDSFWARVERQIEGSGAQWTFLQPTGFASNTLMWAHQVRTGVVRWPYGAAARSLIHERDLAAVAVLALTEDGHSGMRYLLTGPQAITQSEQVEIIGAAIGRPVRWQDAPREEVRSQLAAALGPAFADHALDSWAAMVARPEPVTRVVEEVTGVPARTFRQWAGDHSADFLPAAGPARTADIADRYVRAFRGGDLDAALAMLAPGVVRVAPAEAFSGRSELVGVQAIMDNSARFNADIQILAVEVGRRRGGLPDACAHSLACLKAAGQHRFVLRRDYRLRTAASRGAQGSRRCSQRRGSHRCLEAAA
jgi:uncharacterized protein YbjT (DUF2867 family)